MSETKKKERFANNCTVHGGYAAFAAIVMTVSVINCKLIKVSQAS